MSVVAPKYERVVPYQRLKQPKIETTCVESGRRRLERWTLTRGFDYSDLTLNVMVF